MDKQDPPSLPDGHLMREYWRNRKLLHSIEGMIQLAEEGDRHAARQLLALFLHQAERYQETLNADNPYIPEPPDPRLLEYLADCLCETLAGESADVSLHLRRGKGGGGRNKLNSKEEAQKVRMAFHMSDVLDRDESEPKMSKPTAEALTADEFHVSPEKVKEAYRKYVKI